jgi:hypothetical protein
MNDQGCTPGKFCTSGMTSVKDARPCPPGRVCGKATAVGSKEQIKSCEFDDPNYCYIGDICLTGYFCKEGISKNDEANWCYNLSSFSGARERFLCSRTLASNIFAYLDWEKLELVDINQYMNEGKVTRMLQNNNIGQILSDPKYTMTCYEDTIEQGDTVLFDLDFSKQNGYPPDHYMILIKIKSLLTDKTEVINLFENNQYGSYNEIPLMPDARYFIMKEDFKFTIRVMAVHSIKLSILTQYYKGPYFNNFYTNTIKDCRTFVTRQRNNSTIQDNLVTK